MVCHSCFKQVASCRSSFETKRETKQRGSGPRVVFSLLFFPYAEESEESEDEMVKLRPVFVGPVSGETIKHRSCSFLMTYSVPSPQLEGLPPDLPHLPPSRLESLHLICACGAALERPCGFSTQTAMSEAQTEKVTQTCAFSHCLFPRKCGCLLYWLKLNV